MRLFSLWIFKYIYLSLGFLYILCIDLPSLTTLLTQLMEGKSNLKGCGSLLCLCASPHTEAQEAALAQGRGGRRPGRGPELGVPGQVRRGWEGGSLRDSAGT